MKKAFIYDLDNTIYAVSSISKILFADLFALIENSTEHNGNIEGIKHELQRRPYQLVAKEFGFSESLTQAGFDLLNIMSYDDAIHPFPDYGEILLLEGDRFLVTTGFTKLQWSKIRGMQIEQHFLEIHIVDPSNSSRTKRDVFADIIERHGYTIAEVVVIGDDPKSEISAAQQLGIEAVLVDKTSQFPDAVVDHRVSGFGELRRIYQNL